MTRAHDFEHAVRRGVLALVAAAALAAGPGCLRYRPLGSATAPLGEDLRGRRIRVLFLASTALLIQESRQLPDTGH